MAHWQRNLLPPMRKSISSPRTLMPRRAVTVDGNNLFTNVSVKWPDGTPGKLTITGCDANNGILAYNIAYVLRSYVNPRGYYSDTCTSTASDTAIWLPPYRHSFRAILYRIVS